MFLVYISGEFKDKGVIAGEGRFFSYNAIHNVVYGKPILFFFMAHKPILIFESCAGEKPFSIVT